MKKDYIKIAKELFYDPSIYSKIAKCKTEEEINRVMTTYRKRLQ